MKLKTLSIADLYALLSYHKDIIGDLDIQYQSDQDTLIKLTPIVSKINDEIRSRISKLDL
jgi:hypothetical protein